MNASIFIDSMKVSRLYKVNDSRPCFEVSFFTGKNEVFELTVFMENGKNEVIPMLNKVIEQIKQEIDQYEKKYV